MMLEVKQALDLVLGYARPGKTVRIDPRQAAGWTLAEDIATTIDSPPYSKSLMDGYALHADDLAAVSDASADTAAVFSVIGEIAAGDQPSLSLQPGQAARIMTGAPLPTGAAAVAMVERCQPQDDSRVQIQRHALPPGANIMQCGDVMKHGDVIMHAGHAIRPVDAGLLCEAGAMSPLCYLAPRVALVTTGNEVVDPAVTPQPGQIRNSNGPMLAQLATQAGGMIVVQKHVEDDRETLAEELSRVLHIDVVIITGGVSAGDFDYIPGVLRELGVEQVFHGVKIKPGKPIWFGVKQHDEGATLVFGLPGNPVSCLACFYMFVQPALLACSGCEHERPAFEPAALTAAYQHRGNRYTCWPAVLEHRSSGNLVTPLDWRGSADLRTVSNANCFAIFDQAPGEIAAGSIIQTLPF